MGSYVWRQYDDLFRHIKGHCPSLKWHIVQPEILRKAKAVCDRSNPQAKRKVDNALSFLNKSKNANATK